MARCEQCNKWFLVPALLPGFHFCGNCARDWYATCRRFLLEPQTAKELFRISRVTLAMAQNHSEDIQYKDLEGDVLFLDRAVAFLAYFIGAREKPGQATQTLATTFAFGVAGSLLAAYGQSRDGKILTDTKSLTPADRELTSKLERLSRGENADSMTVDTITAIKGFPYVMVIKRDRITAVDFKRGSELVVSTKFGDATFSVPTKGLIERAFLRKIETAIRNPANVWRGVEDKVMAYVTRREET